MRIFLYEHLTGGGQLGDDVPSGSSEIDPAARDSLFREGRAMRDALAEDLAAMPGVEVTILHNARMPCPAAASLPPEGARMIEVSTPTEQRAAFGSLAGQCDWTIVIAPETDGVLLDHCHRALAAGGRLLGPSPEFVALAADKHATAQHLAAAGVPVPRGVALATGETLPRDFAYPAVLKPRDGAGSQDVRRIQSTNDMVCVPWPARLEEYRPGQPASVAMLGKLSANHRPKVVVLEPCSQHLSQDGRFTYLGGSVPSSPNLAARARRLAERVADALPAFVGYVGIDFVLGTSKDGSDDRVIEVNPRLTTSYVGLRAAAETNLAAAMLALAAGESPQVVFSREALAAGIVFDSSGQVTRGAHELARA